MTRTTITLFATLISVAIFFSQATVSEAEWTILREDNFVRDDGIDARLQDVHFMDTLNGLVVGDNGLILVTTGRWQNLGQNRS